MSDTNPIAPASLAPSAAGPLPASEIHAYDTAPPEHRAEIDRVLAELDISDSNAILFFGTNAQEEVTSVADEMLEGVRNKDTGAAGQTLNEMVATLRGFSAQELDANRKSGVMRRLLGRTRPLAKVLQRYEHVRSQIDAISNRLDSHTSTLMKDIALLDRL